MVHKYVSAIKKVHVERIFKNKTFKVCLDCGKPLSRRRRGEGDRCLSCTQKHRWRLYRKKHDLDK